MLFGAIVMGRISLLDPLEKNGADKNQDMFNGVTPALLAAAVASPECLEKIIELGADPLAIDQSGQNAVSHAAAAGRTRNIALLLAKGASPDAPNPDAVPPLCAAASSGQLASVKALLAAKANPDVTMPRTKSTPWSLAKQRGDEAMLKVLRDAGARED